MIPFTREALEFYAGGGDDGGMRAREALAENDEERIIDAATIVRGRNGRYHVRASSANGEIILWSEQYLDADWARRVARDLGVPVTDET